MSHFKIAQYHYNLLSVLRHRYFQLQQKNPSLTSWSVSPLMSSPSSSDLRSSSSSRSSPKKPPTKIPTSSSSDGRHHQGSTLSLQVFDTSLRDGIQMASPTAYPLSLKQNLLWHIMTTYCPDAIEIGSVVSPKVLPIFADSLELMDFAQDAAKEGAEMGYKPPPRLFLLTPNLNALQRALQHSASKKQKYHYPIHYSFITSMTDGFQGKNTRKTLVEHKLELAAMGRLLAKSSPQSYLKLYISCVSECPVEQRKSDVHDIAIEVVNYLSLVRPVENVEICLSDTMGTLTFEEFKTIVDLIRYRYGREDPSILSKLSLHLHVEKSNLDEVRQIVWYSFVRGIHRFDVSCLENGGGCKTTLDPKDAKPNLQYSMLYDFLLTTNK